MSQADESVTVTANYSVPANPVDWSRYRAPDECHHTVIRMIDSMASGTRADTLLYRLTDTMATVVRKTATDCFKRFPLTALRPFQLPLMRDLAVYSNDDASIRAAVAAELASMTTATPHAKAIYIHEVIAQLVAARPARIRLAKEFADQADGFGDGALFARAQIRGGLGPVLAYEGNLDSMIVYYQKAVDYATAAKVEGLSAEQQKYHAVYIPMMTAELNWYKYLKTYSSEVLHQYVSYQNERELSPGVFALVGKKAPLIAGDFWFQAPIEETKAVSMPGRVTLVMFVNVNATSWTYYYGYERLRRLRKQFPTVRILLVAGTNGRFRDLPVPLPPEREAALLHHYFVDSLKLPGTLTVSTRQYEEFTDGRLLATATDNEVAYSTTPENSINRYFLIDQAGRIVKTHGFFGKADMANAIEEYMLAIALESLLKQPASTLGAWVK